MKKMLMDFLDSQMPDLASCLSHQIPHHTELTSRQMPGVCPGKWRIGLLGFDWYIKLTIIPFIVDNLVCERIQSNQKLFYVSLWSRLTTRTHPMIFTHAMPNLLHYSCSILDYWGIQITWDMQMSKIKFCVWVSSFSPLSCGNGWQTKYACYSKS